MELFQPSFGTYHIPILEECSSIASEGVRSLHSHPCPPLLKIIAIATTLETNIFPLTWRPALETLGEGLTGNVSQSPLNANISLAFKRLNGFLDRDSNRSDTEPSLSPFDAMLSEILVLSSPSIYDHPNVVNLEGLCWEIVKETEDVWPVMVFRKADSGNLPKFLSRPEALGLDSEDLISLCGEVAKGLQALHMSNVVHGDIKPDNVLVFNSSTPDEYGIKVTDLGCSSFGIKEDDLVKLPQSEPWEAREYHKRWFSLKAAKRMDVYSFGLFVLWLFFHKERFTYREDVETKLGEAFETGTMACEALQSSKDDGTILSYALDLVAKSPHLSDDARLILQQVFNLSLQWDPNRRAPDMQQVALSLGSNDVTHAANETQQNETIEVPSWHGNLNLAKFVFELDCCDFRVQSSVFKALRLLAGYKECEACSQNAAFQLALCYVLGFGAHANNQKSQQWLSKSGRDRKELEEALSTITAMKPSISSMSQLIDLGYQSQLGQDYEDDGIIDQAITEYQAMATSRERAFGRVHFLTRHMYVCLADFLRDTDKAPQAAQIYEEEIAVLANLYGPKSRSEPLLKSKLAQTYMKIGKLEEAEVMAVEAFDSYSTESSEDMSLKMAALCDLSKITLERGRHEEALERALVAVHGSEDYLGSSHRTTFRARGLVSSVYHQTGQIQKAAQLMEQLYQEKRAAFGDQNSETLASLEQLGMLYVEMREWLKALNTHKELCEALEKVEGENARLTLAARSNYAGALSRTGDAQLAASILEEILSEMARNPDSAEGNMLGTMANLATAYSLQGLWEKAEPIQREVLARTRQTFGESNDRTLVALQNLSDTLYTRKKWKEVVKYASQELELRKSTSPGMSADTLDALTKVARSNAYLQNWCEAIPQLKVEMHRRDQMSKTDSLDGLEATVLVAIGELNLQQYEAARIRIAEFFALFIRVGLGRKTLLDAVYQLAALSEEKGLLEEAEELLKLAVLIRHKLFSEATESPKEELDRERILGLRARLGKSDDEIIWDPTSIIERKRT